MDFPTIDVKATGARIRQLRMERGLTIRDVSEYMGFSTDQAVCKWQRGDSLPSLDNLYALSKLYETTMEDILVGYDEMSSRFFVYHNPSPLPVPYPQPLLLWGSENTRSFHICAF